LWYYGDLFPNTYYAKAAYIPVYDRGWEYLRTYFHVYDFAPLLLIPAVAALLTRDAVIRRFLAGCLAGGGAVFFYVIRLGGDFMEWRFLVPVTGALFAGIGVGLYVLGDGLVRFFIGRLAGRKDFERAWVSVVAVVTGIACALAGLGYLHHVTNAGRQLADHTVIVGQETIPWLAKYALPEYAWDEIGRTCGRILPPDTKIATTAAGMIPFFSRLPTLDLHGLTDRTIARQPIAPEITHRMGHEHELEDRDVMRERGIEVYLQWPQLWDFPPALGMDERPGETNASLRLPTGRYFDVVFLNPAGELVRNLRNQGDVVFRDPSQLIPKDQMVLHAWLLGDHRLVDRLDWEDPESEDLHEFEELFDEKAPYGHNRHDKVLAYLGLGVQRVLRDEGRVIYHQASWVVRGVSASKDMTMIVRHNHLVSNNYHLLVNGRRLPYLLKFPRLPEQWGEVRMIIHREFLREGENRFLISRDRAVDGEVEFFHMWFLQKSKGADNERAMAP
jgi:hypothetical protein